MKWNLTAAAAVLLVTAPALADEPAGQSGQDTSDLEDLLGESVVTTASRGPERARVAPATVVNITAGDIAESGARTVSEALDFLGLGVYIAEPRDYTSAGDVGAQGLLFRDGGRHVLVLLDGMVLNSQATGRISLNEALGVPIEGIDHIEVMLGPGSVAYGSNAMLAVINIVTRGGHDLRGLRLSAELGGAMAQDERGTPTTTAGTRPGVRYRLSAGGGASFRLGRTRGEATAVIEWTHDESASYAVTPYSQWTRTDQSFPPEGGASGGAVSHSMRALSGIATARAGAFRLLVDGFAYRRTMPLVGTFDDPATREVQSGLRLELRHERDIGVTSGLTSRLYGGRGHFAESSNWLESYWCLPGQETGCRLEMSARSTWVGVEQQIVSDWLLDGKLVTTAGYDARLRDFDGRPADYGDLSTGAPPASLDLIPHSQRLWFQGALFAQQIWRPRAWLAFNVGGRLDADRDWDGDDVGLSPRAAVVFVPAQDTVLRLSYNQAFRSPSPYELTELDPTYRITPSGLRPETVRSVEAEAQQRLGRMQISLRGYAASYADFIESRPASAEEVARFAGLLSPTTDPTMVQVNDNLTALRVAGGTGSLQIRLPGGFALGGTFDAARAQTADGRRFERLPRWYGNFRFGWAQGDAGYSASVVGAFASSRVVMAGFEAMPYRVGERLDLRLTGSGPIGQGGALRWRASLGFDLNPDLPYAVAIGTDTAKGYVLLPDQERLSGFVGLELRLGGR